MEASKILDLAEELNIIYQEYGDVCGSINITIDSKEELQALCNLMSKQMHEPQPDLPYYWAYIQFNKVTIGIKTENVEYELKIKE